MDGMVGEPERRISILVVGGGRHIPTPALWPEGGGWGGEILVSLSVTPFPCSYTPDLLCFSSQGSGQPLGHGPHQYLQESTEAGRAAG